MILPTYTKLISDRIKVLANNSELVIIDSKKPTMNVKLYFQYVN